MAIKANASSQGATGFKNFVGVASFRVLGVNPTKEELDKFNGRDNKEPKAYLTDKLDEKDGNKPYKNLRVTFVLQADDPSRIPEDKTATRECNAALTEPLITSVSFFIDSRYYYNNDKTKVQVIDKYGRTAWVTIEQCKNHQIPVYKNGPARIDPDYRPAFRGEETLTAFILNYLNVTSIDTYNKNTGEWMTNPHPEDCEGRLDKIKNYFNGDISELIDYCGYLPDNCVKMLVGVQTDDQGRQFTTVYNGMSLRNGSKSYSYFKDAIDGSQAQSIKDTIWSSDPIGVISSIKEYKDNVKETNLGNAPVGNIDPFAQAAALPEAGSDLPFGNPIDVDPFKGM